MHFTLLTTLLLSAIPSPQHIFRTLNRHGWELSSQVVPPIGLTNSQSVELLFTGAGPWSLRIAPDICFGFVLSCIDYRPRLEDKLVNRVTTALGQLLDSSRGDDPRLSIALAHIALRPDNRRLFAEQHAGYHFPFLVRLLCFR